MSSAIFRIKQVINPDYRVITGARRAPADAGRPIAAR